jgi:serine protease Do
MPDGPAQRGGLEVGDVIVAFDDDVVKDARGLLDLIARTDVGEGVAIKLVRDGTSRLLRVMGKLKTESIPESEASLIDEASVSNDDDHPPLP